MWQLNSDGSKGTFIGGDVANNIQLRLAKPNTSAITELENTKAISAYDSIRNEDGQLEYKYDGEATDLLGNNTSIDSSFFEIHKLGAYLSSDNKLYEDIEYSINLDKIQAVLSKYGYSVNVDSNNNFWPYYTYSKHSTDNPSFDDDSKVSDDTSSNSDLYIEVQKVLVTQPVSLYVGDELDPTQISDDNPLMKAHIKFTNIDKSNNTTTTKEKDLTVDGKTLTVSAVDAKGNSVDLDKITAKAGTYTLTYTYHLNNGTITNTSTVTVLDKKENPYHDKVATHKYVIRFVSNNKVVKTVTVEGQPDDEIDLTKKQQTVPEGYKLAKGQTVPDFVTIKDTDKTIDIKVVKDATTPVTPTDDPVVHVYFVDKKTGKTIKTVTKNGKVGETVNLTSDEQAIPNNYKLVAGSTIPTSITLTKDIKDITVYLEAKGQTKTDDTHKSENNEDNNHEADNHKEVINKKSEDNTPKNPIKENTTEKTFNKVATKSESAEVKTQVVVSKKQKAINGVQTKLAKATNNENKLPQTGNHDMILALIGLGLTTFAGITLKKKH